MKRKLKLFIWTDFCTDYTEGLAFAIARDETEARELILKEYGEIYQWGNLEVKSVSARIARAVCGGA
jgi:hypothetical protein